MGGYLGSRLSSPLGQFYSSSSGFFFIKKHGRFEFWMAFPGFLPIRDYGYACMSALFEYDEIGYRW